MQKITLNEQRLHDKQAACFFTLLFDLGGGGHLLPTSEEQRARCWLCAETPQAKTPKTSPLLQMFHSGLFGRTSRAEAAVPSSQEASFGKSIWRICTLEDLHGGITTASWNENSQGSARFPCPQHPNFPVWCQNPSCPA